jgi:microcystin-dependent protein
VQADSIRKDYTQVGHGFVKGHVVRFDSDGSLTFAKANNVQNAEAIGIVNAVTGSCITVVSKGYVSGITGTGGFAGIYPLVTGNAYFLSPMTNGGLIADPDSGALMLQPGEIRKAMFVASGFNSGYVVNYTGIVVGDNPTDLVYMRSAAPVGSVHPFAGLTSSVPYGWFVCDGSAKSKEEWPDLFDAIGNIHHADAVVGGDPDAMVMVGDTRGMQAGDAIKVVWATGEVLTTVLSVNTGTRVVTIAGNEFVDLPQGTELRVYGRVVASTTGRSIYFLPDLRRRTVFGTSFGTGLPGSGNVSPQLGIAAVGGDDQVELAIDNIPDHRHTLDINVLPSTVGGNASSVNQTGDMIDLGSNGNPFSIMPPHISMHWIIRAKKGYQATILTGHNHDNYYIRYDIPHTIVSGAARTLTDADRAQFRANAKVLRNDDDDTFNGTLTITENLNVSGTATATEFVGCGTIPLGGIIMWSGSSVPTGWALCDGRVSGGMQTPDLRGRFIVGYNSNTIAGTTTKSEFSQYAIGTLGGLEAVTLTGNQLPSHRHSIEPVSANATIETSNTLGSTYARNNFLRQGNIDIDHGGQEDTTRLVDTLGHTHSITASAVASGIRTGLTGGNQPHENRPPFYALAFIMRVC